MGLTFSVRNFERFQHYKDRSPPWIKLYNELLDDYEFGLLPDATKAHLVAIWLLASRYSNKVPADAEWIARKINATTIVDLTLLEKAGFIQFDQLCSEPLAPRKQTAMPERETETQVETEKETPSLRSGVSAPAVSEPVASAASEEGELPAFLDRRAKKHRLPENFEPDRAAAIAFWRRKEREDLCRDVEDQVTMFKAHYRKAGTRWEDWASTWVGWYSRAIEMTRAPAVSRNAPIVSIFDEPQKAAACR